MNVIQLKHCAVELTDWGCTTRFKDGAEVSAYPHPELPHYSVISHRCGYGDDHLGYCQEHELMHSVCAEWFHDKPSEVLWAMAHGTMLNGKAAAYEEIVAQTMQRWVRANERPIISGINLDAFKKHVLTLLEV